MYFEQLHIQGFKSFVDRTNIEFKPGITAIVGPNGCGKSNISDSIRWVLGEQNIRSLRGNRLEDLIFNGSPGRKPVGMAEVSLTVQNNGELPKATSGQIEVTRRLFRDGESEFYINRVPCRLKDIVELFMDSGLGKGSYAMIEQGKVDLVLRSRPKERRILIEEAAGIIRYKSKKEEALRKIENTHQNLVRIEDRLYELDNIASTLKKQATRAKRYLSDKSTVLELEKQFYSFQLRMNREQVQKVTEQSESLFDEITKLETQLATTAQTKALKEENLEHLREELNGFHSQKSVMEKDIDLSLQNIEFSRKRIVELTEELEELDFEIEELQEKKESTLFEYNQLDAEHEELMGKVHDAEKAVQKRQLLFEEITEQLQRQRESREKTQKEHLKILARLSQLKQQTTKIHSNIEEIDRREGRLQKEHDEYCQKSKTCDPQLLELTDQIHDIEKKRENCLQQIENLKSEIKAGQQHLNELKTSHDDIKARYLKNEARFLSLQEMENSREGYSPGITSLLDVIKKEKKALDFTVLADHIPPNINNNLPVIMALQSYLEAVVIDDRQTALSIVKLVQEQNVGRVGIISDTCREKLHVNKEEIKDHQDIQLLSDYIKANNQIDPVLHNFLDSVALTPSIEKALEHLSHSSRRFTYVTSEGTVIDHNGVIYCGQLQDQTSEIFSRKQELIELQEENEKLRNDLDIWNSKIEMQNSALIEKMGARESHEKEELNLQLTKQNIVKDLNVLENEKKKYDESVKISNLEIEQLAFDRQHHQEELLKSEEECKQIEKQKSEVEQMTQELEAQIEELGQQRDQMQTELTECQIRWTSLKEKVENTQRTMQSHQEMMDEYENQISRNNNRIKEAKKQNNSHQTTIINSEEKLKTLHSDHSSVLQEIESRTTDFQTVKAEVEKEIEWEKVLTKTVNPLKEQFNDLKVEINSLEIQKQHLLEDIHRRLKSSLEDVESIDYQPASDEEIELLKKKIDQMNRRLEAYDDLNLSAPEEYEAVHNKIEEMNNQKKDVLDAIETLQETVIKIDRESQQRFQLCFEEVNSNFQSLFQRLFGGGFAELQLEDDQDLLETGITIVAQPPGKKLQTLSLLSGGEKALAAIAFLVAIFYYRPSPLCFLDEVDAALDDVNTTRFCKLLQEMSEKSQIIMVTHSKKTVEIANVFYGVTMSEPGISKIISLELEEAKEEQLSA